MKLNTSLLCTIVARLLAVGLLVFPIACSAKTKQAAKPVVEATTQPTTKPVVRAWKMNPVPADEVNLVLMGDWVPENSNRQQETADALVRYVAATRVQFNGLLSIGDNTFGKLPGGINDVQFAKHFEDVYDPQILNFPFYLVLGNHDHEHGAMAIQLAYAAANPHSRWKMPARWYRLDFPEDKPLITVLMLDSNQPKLKKEEWQQQLKWVEQQLADTKRGAWTMLVGHQPLYSNGGHGDNSVLQKDFGPMLKKHKVDFYVSGHEHNLQHIQVPEYSTSFLVSGGGGRKRTKFYRDDRGPFTGYFYGFAHLRVTADGATVKFVSFEDKLVHHFDRAKDGKLSIVSTKGVAKATTEENKTTVNFGESRPKKPATRPATKAAGGS